MPEPLARIDERTEQIPMRVVRPLRAKFLAAAKLLLGRPCLPSC